MDTQLLSIIGYLQELEQDSTVPKNVKGKIVSTIKALQEDRELSIKVSKALHELEVLTEECNMQPYTRTQLFNIVSLLEAVS